MAIDGNKFDDLLKAPDFWRYTPCNAYKAPINPETGSPKGNQDW